VTFSLLGLDRETGAVGCVVSSSSPAVAARCAHVRAGVGAAGSQNITDPRLGPRLLDFLAEGREPSEAVDAVTADTPDAAYRQLTVLDLRGRTAAYSGERTLGRNSTAEGRDAVAAGNLLADEGVVAAMVGAFERADGSALGDRLVAALAAGLEAGGEEDDVRSAGLLVADRLPWPIADLRVDWSDDPVSELAALWRIWKPQQDDYVTRALNPSSAPSFGVAGDPRR
jgi:uncharacterized Ntn-hydrolase superfamily protein